MDKAMQKLQELTISKLLLYYKYYKSFKEYTQFLIQYII